jgi:hypothetical protein
MQWQFLKFNIDDDYKLVEGNMQALSYQFNVTRSGSAVGAKSLQKKRINKVPLVKAIFYLIFMYST